MAEMLCTGNMHDKQRIVCVRGGSVVRLSLMK